MVRHLTPLEKELAVVRGMQLLSAIDKSDKTLVAIRDVIRSMARDGIQEDATGKAGYTELMAGQGLYYLMLNIHSVLFQDSYKRKKEDTVNDPERPGVVQSDDMNPGLREVLNTFSKQFFHIENTPVNYKEFPQIFAKCYQEMAKLQPFLYGNEQTTCLLLTILTELAKSRNIYFDLRRISDDETGMLSFDNINTHGFQSDKIIKIFEKALSLAINREEMPEVKPWEKRVDSTIEIGGLRFLMVMRDDMPCLVTSGGGFVPLNKPHANYDNLSLEGLIKQYLMTGKLIDTVRIKAENVIGYVNAGSADKKEADGLDITSGAPLICMDVNPLTGLTDRYNNILARVLKKENRQFIDLADDIPSLLTAEDEFNEQLQVAIKHSKAVKKVVDAAVEKAFSGKLPVGNRKNHVVITMGGAGSGKGGMGEVLICKKSGGENYVKASLDDARYEFGLYRIMVEANHHADDYMAVAEGAGLIRKAIAERAVKEGYNLFYDASGIPWEKYADLARQWKDSVKEIDVCAVECQLYVDSNRAAQFPFPAHHRVISRFNSESRTLPHSEMLKRHIAAPDAYLKAFADPSIQEFMIIDNAGEQGSAYIIAQKFSVDKALLGQLDAVQQGKRLLDFLKEQNIFPEIKTHETTEDNIDFLVHKVKADQYSILVITDRSRFIDIVQKAEMNPDATGYEALPHAGLTSRWLHDASIIRHESGVRINTNGR